MQTIRSLLFYTVLFLSTLSLGLLVILLAWVTGRKDWGHLVGRFWGGINLRAAGVHINVTGIENINPSQAYIYASNHQSLFDILAILGKLPVQFRWLAKQELFEIPILGRAMATIGYIPIDRRDRKKAFKSLARAAGQVQNGTSIVIFPEGTRSSDGRLQPFKKGGFILAIHSQQPVVPVSISGSYQILSKNGGWKIHPGEIHMTVGSPVPTAGLAMSDRDALIGRVHDAIRQHLTQAEGGVRLNSEHL